MAELDSCASNNFVKLSILTESERNNLRPGPTHADLAVDGAFMQLDGTIDLIPYLGGHAYPASFHACAALRADLILGRSCLKDHDVHHEHRTDCL